MAPIKFKKLLPKWEQLIYNNFWNVKESNQSLDPIETNVDDAVVDEMSNMAALYPYNGAY